MKKRIFGGIAAVLAAILLLVGGYVAYVFIDYSRLEDHLTLTVENNNERVLTTEEEISLVTWNLGFGAYSDDYTFFMDGGKSSRAFSEEAVYENMDGALTTLKGLNPDLLLLQEIDTKSTRSYHVDESTLIRDAFPAYASIFALNYDSSYLFYPLMKPIGKSVSGIMTLSSFTVDQSIRRSLPVETGFMKFLDLDRCYSVTTITVDNGKTLSLYNLHLSAYTSDGAIATKQLQLLLADMEEAAAKGHYVIAGGDFNKDLYGNSPEIFGVDGAAYTWAQPFPKELLPAGLTLADSYREEAPVPSCRNTDIPYRAGETFVITADGFIVSDNVTVKTTVVLDKAFRYSDHNPVKMTFTLNP